MTQTVTEIREWHNVTRRIFEHEIVPLDEPAVIRSLLMDWPAVQKSTSTASQFTDYLKSFDNAKSVYTIVGEPEINGRFFYTDDLKGVNFKRANVNFCSAIDQIIALENNPSPHAIAIQSASIREALPEFDQFNSMPLLDESVSPTMWIGNRALVAPHYDVRDNLAAVVYGRRKFTLFPPDQVANLYVGPALESPGGVPISLVDLDEPDLDKFPNYQKAIEVAQTATLQPGDAIFIPSPWWHAVQSLDAFNMLVNYWWGGSTEHQVSPNNSLMHSILTIGSMSPQKRASWKHFYDYYVFKQTGDPAEHLPDELQDILTNLSERQLQMLLAFLKSTLS